MRTSTIWYWFAFIIWVLGVFRIIDFTGFYVALIIANIWRAREWEL